MDQPQTPPPPSDPRTRGELVVTERAAIKVVEGAFSQNAPNVSRPSVQIMSMSDDAVEIQVSFAVDYPTAALTEVLAGVRRTVALEVARQLSRPVTRLDLTVSEFTTPTPTPPRRVV